MIRFRGRVFFPIPFSPWVLTRHVKRSGRCAIIFFIDGRMYGYIRGYRRILNPDPLMAMTYFYIGIVLDPRERRIENILIQDVLGVVWLLLRLGLYKGHYSNKCN